MHDDLFPKTQEELIYEAFNKAYLICVILGVLLMLTIATAVHFGGKTIPIAPGQHPTTTIENAAQP